MHGTDVFVLYTRQLQEHVQVDSVLSGPLLCDEAPPTISSPSNSVPPRYSRSDDQDNKLRISAYLAHS
jgi:hypothetical protein